ncbi:MAG: hypothetical protein ACOCZB_03145 [Spirochaetota bacterium]
MSDKRVPDILIEQYVLGELSEEEAREVERSEGFAERVAAIERDNVAFLRNHPADVFAVRIRNQYESERAEGSRDSVRTRGTTRARTLRIMAFAVPGAAALVAFAFVLFGGMGFDPGTIVDPDTEIVRLKGAEPHIAIYRAIGNGRSDAEELRDGDSASSGDTLQLAYNAAGKPYGAIVSVDGRGAVTLHYPLTVSADPDLVAGGERQLPYAYQLDDAPDFERFFFITSEETFSVARVLDQVEEQAGAIVDDPDRDLRLASAFTVQSSTIRKGD